LTPCWPNWLRIAAEIAPAQTMLANPDVVPFRQATLFLLARLAGGNTIPTLRETRRLANAWGRFQSARDRKPVFGHN
jgi:hypothetical protein